jgi:hypothetical protein
MVATLANNDYPVLDGVAPSFADIILRVSPAGAPLLDMKWIKSINTGRTVEVGEARQGGRVFKRTTGSGSQEASMTVYREGHILLLRSLAALAPKRGNTKLVSLVIFGLQIQHTPPGSIEIYERRIKGCRLLGDALNSAEGTDADTVDLTLNPLEIVDVIDGEEVALI